jgi:hypothetical protein
MPSAKTERERVREVAEVLDDDDPTGRPDSLGKGLE